MKAINILLGLSAMLMAGVSAIGDCDSGPFGDPFAIGDVHDDSKVDVDICETQWKQGNTVKAIEVWATDKNLAGIVLTYSNDDHSHMIGSADGESKKLEWDPKVDKITDLHMWSNPQATRLGKIYIKLSNGNTLDIGMKKPGSHTWYMNVYSGIMLGGYGRADSAVTAFGFLFLSDTVAKIELGDFKFATNLDDFVAEQQENGKLVYDSAKVYSTASNASNIWIERSQAQTNSYSYEQDVSWSFGLHYELEISAQVAGLGPKASGGWDWSVGMDFKKTWSESETTTLTFKVNQPAVPNYTTMCIGQTQSGSFESDYDCNVHITLKNGQTFDFRQGGKKKQVIFGQSETRCADKEGNHLDEDPQQFVDSDQPSKRDLGKFIARTFKA